MNALASLDLPDPVQAELDAAKQWLQDLTLNGLDQHHAVLAHYLGALVQRAQGQDDRVRRLLLEKFSAKKQTLLGSLSAALQGVAGNDATVALTPHADTLAGLTQRLDQLREQPDGGHKQHRDGFSPGAEVRDQSAQHLVAAGGGQAA